MNGLNELIKGKENSARQMWALAVITVGVILAYVGLSAASPLAQRGHIDHYPHDQAAHKALECAQCHKRETNAAQPKMPGHAACAQCHQNRFDAKDRAFCIVCHSNPSAAKVKSFPTLSGFSVRFAHASHRLQECSVCHKTTGGATISLPTGIAAHSACFRCHGFESHGAKGKDISSCGVCHELGGIRPTASGFRAYRVNFSHTAHAVAGMKNCSDCHEIKRSGPRAEITKPTVAEHHKAGAELGCFTCHNGQRAFGPPDFKSCRRCHTGNDFGLSPGSSAE
jgi:c(7)-type cytochrome triheme protein